MHACIGEGNGNPLQYSCLENPVDGEAWWAAVHGVAQSQTRLKQLSTYFKCSMQCSSCGTVLESYSIDPNHSRVCALEHFFLNHRKE